MMYDNYNSRMSKMTFSTGSDGFQQVLMGFNGFQWVSMGFNGFQWGFNGVSMGFQWGFDGLCWVLMLHYEEQ